MGPSFRPSEWGCSSFTLDQTSLPGRTLTPMPSDTIWTIWQHRFFGTSSGDFFGLGLASKLFCPPKMLGRLASSGSWASEAGRSSSKAQKSWRQAAKNPLLKRSLLTLIVEVQFRMVRLLIPHS